MALPFEDRITSEMKVAMKAKESVKLNCLRAIKSALKYKEVEKKQEAVTDEEAIQVLTTMVKQRKESIEQFEKFDRQEQADKEKQEIEVIQAFLPEQLSEDEVKKLVADAVASTGAQGPKEMGKVMKELKPKVAGKADNKLVADLVRQSLAG
jgi:uncharacterized protein YqeY